MHLTIAAWIFYFVIAVIIIMGASFLVYCETETKQGITTGAMAGLLISIFILLGMNWYYTNTASGSRALKSQQSNLSNGIQREVKIYDINGKLIKEYNGKFDITYNNDRILFDDENGKRHIVYYPTGTVIIDEVEE